MTTNTPNRTTARTATRPSSAWPITPGRPLTALVKAEYRQFLRNKTLVFLATAIPIGNPLVIYLIARRQGTVSPALSATILEMFVLMALLFVLYYSILSMVTTRRGEGVLKRLRTGEAADWQIQVAPTIPGAVITLVGSVVVSVATFIALGAAPVNPVALLLAVIGGIVTFSLLAIATSAVTKNAEAAQMTSLPVMLLTFVGLAAIRNVLPDRLGEIVSWTPFAAISDLVSLGSVGKLATAPEGAAALDFAGTFSEIGQPVATLAAWTAVAYVLALRYFRWDDRG